MKLGFLTACLPNRSLADIAAWAAANDFAALYYNPAGLTAIRLAFEEKLEIDTSFAVPGLARIQSSSSEGNSQVRLQFEWGADLAEAADEIRTRVDRMRGRLPEARPHTLQECQRRPVLLRGHRPSQPHRRPTGLDTWR